MEEKKKLWWKRQPLWIGFIFLILSVVIFGNGMQAEIIKAGVYDNAYTFYQQHGNEMMFVPGDTNEGEIYYATMGKKNVTSGIRYTTIGWKVRLFHSDGALVETIYYKLGGNYMTSVDVRTVGEYEYCLYRITLSNLKARLSQTAKTVLNNPNCNIVFDACVTTRKQGNLQGGMTDLGPNWGEVYTTYNEIVHAADWSTATKESLKSYYNKTVKGLFYDVTLKKEIGIRQVSGDGKYCFGTTVTVQAECEDGFHFEGWTGSKQDDSEIYSFVIYGNDVSLTAKAKENYYKVQFDCGGGEGDIPEQIHFYRDTFFLPQMGISMKDAMLSGWKVLGKNTERSFTIGQMVSVEELVRYLNLQKTNGATITLFATWDKGPSIQTETIYASLTDAVSGRITEEWLAKRGKAFDREDGEIPYGRNQKTSFLIENYESKDFTEIQGEGIVNQTFFAKDSVGNITRKEVQICIEDTRFYPIEKMFGRVRFISAAYFEDEDGNLISEEEGGLAKDSIWRWDKSYRDLLKKLFE